MTQRKINYGKFEREFELVYAPRTGTLARRYRVTDCGQGPDGITVELYVRKEDAEKVREGAQNSFPVFRITHEDTFIPDYRKLFRIQVSAVILKVILDKDVSSIIREKIRRG